ncbi:ParB/RepB/Spo0J family partition protein [Thiopseudomonas acetoxidans]|uniref:Probable chromosome-partitioning protein ParB n=1 Tax=Thiopseudomonas acetoxidans TaxID=3041622 RepID=A0ABT7SMW9_9GAMM|nr:ParB/RepB/Spo0J family partition protein [Thiopseudomonas sp. CY1220]MDM7857523.1 ParB/RepB/Spo0J family partition protein [Thiopseudomonas sp. CY1220]
MAVKKRGLGRGLDALLGGANASSQYHEAQENELLHIAIDRIQPGKYQPRRDMDPAALEELSKSIKAQGIMQPIVVRSVGSNKYEIIAGERRWRAAQLAELKTVPALLKQVADDAAIAMALIENIQREDLNPIEEAIALQRLQHEYELTQQEVADAVGKSRTTVTNLLRLINLPEEVKIMLAHGDIEMGHARALLGLAEPQLLLAARHVVATGLNVRQTEAYIRSLQKPKAKPTTPKADPDIQRLEKKLAERLGANVKIKHTDKGKGQLVINYGSLDELQGVLAHIQ